MQFEVKEDHSRGQARVFALVGELDLATAPDVREPLFEAIAAGTHQLVLDLAELTFVDSTGIATLLSVRRRIQAAGGALAVANVSDHVANVFTITGVAGPLDVQPSRAAAVKAVGARARDLRAPA